MLGTRSTKISAAFERQNQRLVMPFTAHPAYFFLPVGFICLLLIYISTETNPRLYSTAKPLQIAEPETESPRIWYSLAPSGDGIRIVSNSGDIFSISSTDGDEQLSVFTSHLKDRMKDLVADVAISNRMHNKTSFVVLSVDEHLNYSHVRPVIYALAEAGVTRYGFEGRIIKN